MIVNYSSDMHFRVPVENHRKKSGGVNAYATLFLRPHDRDGSIVRSFLLEIGIRKYHLIFATPKNVQGAAYDRK